jgi:ketosteroid isomerase-like protein
MASTRTVVETYFNAWTSKDIATAYAQLAPDLEFVGPTTRYKSAEAFLPALEAFAKMTRSARITHLVVDGNQAAMLFDCELPFGTLRIASFFRVENDKIRWYETQFDATDLRKILPPRN